MSQSSLFMQSECIVLCLQVSLPVVFCELKPTPNGPPRDFVLNIIMQIRGWIFMVIWGPLSLKIFYITIQMWWKFHFALFQVLMEWSLQNFAHGTTAVQNFMAIWSPEIELQVNEISVDIELWWKNRLWNGSLGPVFIYGLLVTIIKNWLSFINGKIYSIQQRSVYNTSR